MKPASGLSFFISILLRFFVNPTPSEARAIFVGKSQGKVLQFPKWDEEDDDTQVFQANVNMEKSLASYSKKYNSWTYLKEIKRIDV